MLLVKYHEESFVNIIDSWNMAPPSYIAGVDELLVDPNTVDPDFYLNFHRFTVDGGVLTKGAGAIDDRIIDPGDWVSTYPMASLNL